MSYNPDPIFRDGLNGYRKPAPPSAWERIESGLDRKRRNIVWLKVAAGLCLLIAASVSLLLREKSDPIIETVSTTTTAPALKPVEPIAESHQLSAFSYQSSSKPYQVNSIVERSRNNHPNVVPEDLAVVERSRNEPSNSKQSSVSSQQSAFRRESSVVNREVVDSPNETQQILAVKTDELLETPVSDIQIENSMEGSVKDVIVDQKGTSITYTSDEVNEKFLKKEVIGQATPEKKNASGLQKAIEKALELTNEGTVYSELREKKNEWLSLNMLSNKTEANK